MPPIRILDLRDTYEIGGPGKTILESFSAIDRDRFSLHLGYFRGPNDRGDSPFLSAARAVGMPIHEVRGTGPYDPRLAWRLATLVREQRFDIVHAHEANSDVLTYLMTFIHRVPIVSTAHGWIANTRKGHVFVNLDKRILRRFDRVIAVSRKLQRDLLDAGVPPEKVTLLHNAIVLKNYRRSAEGGMLAAQLGQPCRPVIVTIGRLSPEKGHLDLVEALAIVAARGHRVTTVLAGDGPARPELEERIRTLRLEDRVHLLGYVPDPARLLGEADLMVLPSHTEGLPNAALEALAMEVPVLATAVGGTPEVITDGETGRLVAPRAPDEIAAALLEFIEDPERWKGWARRGRQMVEAQFDFRTRTRKLEAIYEQMAGL